jgi:pyruvate,water dikinase
VPDGFVLSADAYRAFIATPSLAPLAASLGEVDAGEATSPGVGARLELLRKAIDAEPLPPAAVEALWRSLEEAGLDRAVVAVRSSAAAEDGAVASFAGAHRSILDVRGADAVVDAVRDVYASLWTPQALAYRRRAGIADAAVACAVVVCRMVRAQTAGVAFTCEPRTGRRDAIAISAAAGTGDAVVSGAVNPEEVIVALTTRGLAVESRSGPRVLDDAQLMTVARLALRIEGALGRGQDPQDIEWVFDGARFHLLQARPVTRVPRVALPGSEHLPVVWSTANIKDAVPFVPTTMAWSCIVPALRFMLWAYPAKVGYPVPKGTEVVRRFAGRGYFDATSLQWIFYDCFGVPPAESNRGMGGHHDAIPVPSAHPLRGRRGWQRVTRRLAGARILLALPKTVPAEIDRVFRHAREFLAIDPSPLSAAELLDLLERISRLQLAYGEPFMLASSALVWQARLETLIEKIAPGRGIPLAAALVAGTGDVVSAAHGVRLFDVADAARRDPAALAWLAAAPHAAHGWRALPPASPFRQELTRYLDDYGHRAVYEAEVATPRWNEDPSWLLEQVRMILDGDGRRPLDVARRRRADAEREVRRLTWLRRPQIRWLARRAREGAALRERAKSALVAQIGPLRRALLEVGRRLVAADLASAPEDVFHLAFTDVEAWLRGEWDGRGLHALVEDRKAEMAAWERQRPPDVIYADAPMPPPRVAATRRAGTAILTGMAVSGGRASGPARIIRHPADGARLRQGDVLVAPSTDPGWTPLFLRASAVVMEVGGMLSHGSIVAREYGLPAVVNVPGLLDLVTEGGELIVDGDAGTITVA